MTGTYVGDYVRQAEQGVDDVAREILEIERHQQQVAIRIVKLQAKLNEAEADNLIIEMALNRIIGFYQEQHPAAPRDREELLRWLEEGDED